MDNMNNLICDRNSIKPNYPIDMNTRYLDIYCFGDKEIVFHGYYDFNYSFALFKIVWNQGLKFEDLIWRILYGEWPCLAQKNDFYKLLGYDNIEETYASIRLKRCFHYGNMVFQHGA